ncbi:hypothetical protein K439DRAFT_1619656 [Ramaria rubella]|nr:hypothetical protein K439DRAFT_1619656 [Ramaria rubella]
MPVYVLCGKNRLVWQTPAQYWSVRDRSNKYRHVTMTKGSKRTCSKACIDDSSESERESSDTSKSNNFPSDNKKSQFEQRYKVDTSTPEQVLEQQQKVWMSDVYDHFKMPLDIKVIGDGIKYVFICKSYVFTAFPFSLNTYYYLEIPQNRLHAPMSMIQQAIWWHTRLVVHPTRQKGCPASRVLHTVLHILMDICATSWLFGWPGTIDPMPLCKTQSFWRFSACFLTWWTS